jgi:uncharacterized delta-60 repeat protein
MNEAAVRFAGSGVRWVAALLVVLLAAAMLTGSRARAVAQPVRGGLDPVFGRVTTDFGGTDIAYTATIQADGKIIAAGQTDRNGPTAIAIARYLRNGAPDPSFGEGGRVVTDLGAPASAYAVRTRNDDGTVIVAGVAGADFVLLRYTADGQLDPDFGTGGAVRLPISGAQSVVYAMWLQRDGKVLVAGNAPFALARFLPDGELDPDFGEGGTVPAIDDGRPVQGIGVWRSSNDTISHVRFSGRSYLLSRYDPDGAPMDDDSDCDLAGGVDGAYDLDFEPGGRLVVAGVAGGRSALARYNDDCSLDPSFGEGGVLHIDTVLEAYYITVVVDNKILLVGASGGDFALARFESAAPGDVLLADDFASAATGVFSTSGQAGRSRYAYSGGEFVISKVDAAWEQYPISSVPGLYADATLAVDVRITGPVSGRFIALGCRDSAEGYYVLLVDVENGTFRLGRRGDSAFDHVEDQFAPVIRQGSAVNRYELRCAGSELSVTINGQRVATVSDGNLQEGELFIGVGVYSNRLPATAEARFDNLRVIRQ